VGPAARAARLTAMSSWDPGPRRPRRVVAWLALLPFAAGVAVALTVARHPLGARYIVRADVCEALDLGPVAAGMASSVRPDAPSVIDSADARAAKICRFELDRVGGTFLGVGEATVSWFDNALIGDLKYAQFRGSADGSLAQKSDVRDVSGLGDRAYVQHVNEQRIADFRVVVQESNLILEIWVATAWAEPGTWQPGRPDPAFAALTDAARASVSRLR
jgi:hypothetical protein